MRSFCAEICRTLAEPLAATAPVKARGWLLIQHPGPWPATGLPDELPPELHNVAALASAAGVRPQLIRRTVDRAPTWPLGIYLASSAGPAPWLEFREFADPDRLATILDLLSPANLEATAAGRRTGFGVPVGHRLLVVCTHGSRDRCCAKAGRPVAVALARHFPDLVWETSHLGGDRFAANLVTLPDGSYHGGLDTDPDRVEQVATATLRGAVDLAHYRGRSGRSAAAQAADWHARRSTGLTDLDAVRVVAEQVDADGIVAVDLDVDGVAMRATLQLTEGAPARLISCATGEVSSPEHYALVGLIATARAEPRPSVPAAETSAR
ncbi:MAG: hypothetical protein L0Y54_15590 [Sporichthyaceae bacterium]|nr:hypothetical protein [Sporichthyaceae bacterium]